MNPEQPQGMNESQQEQIGALNTQVADIEADVDGLQTRADKAAERAATSENLATWHIAP